MTANARAALTSAGSQSGMLIMPARAARRSIAGIDEQHQPVDQMRQARQDLGTLVGEQSQRWCGRRAERDPSSAPPSCQKGVRASAIALPAGTPSLRLLADESAKVLAGLSHLIDGLVLLVDARDRSSRRPRA